MKNLILCLVPVEGDGIATIGIDIVWDDENVEFVEFENLSEFESMNAKTADRDPKRLVIAAGIMSGGEVTKEGRFVRLIFKFKEGCPEHDVAFRAENISAISSEGREIKINVDIADYKVSGGTWDLHGIWE